MTRSIGAVRVGALLLLLAAAGCGRRGGGGEAEEPAAGPVVTVRIGALESRTFTDVVRAPGEWRSGTESVLGAPFAAVVESVWVRPGDLVPAGRRVALLVTRESWSAVQGAELLARGAAPGPARQEAARAVALARRELVRVPLVAPAAGLVLRRSVEPGLQVAEGAEIVALAPRRAIVFEAHVPAADAARIRPGEPATIAAPGEPARSASVLRLLPTASEADQAALAWLAPGPGAAPPGLGRFGEAAIVVGPPRRATGVPDSALVEDDLTGRRRVAVVGADGRARWTPVVTGAAAGGWHELVRPALPPGTRVVVEGQRGLPDSTRVRAGS